MFLYNFKRPEEYFFVLLYEIITKQEKAQHQLEKQNGNNGYHHQHAWQREQSCRKLQRKYYNAGT